MGRFRATMATRPGGVLLAFACLSLMAMQGHSEDDFTGVSMLEVPASASVLVSPREGWAVREEATAQSLSAVVLLGEAEFVTKVHASCRCPETGEESELGESESSTGKPPSEKEEQKEREKEKDCDKKEKSDDEDDGDDSEDKSKNEKKVEKADKKAKQAKRKVAMDKDQVKNLALAEKRKAKNIERTKKEVAKEEKQLKKDIEKLPKKVKKSDRKAQEKKIAEKSEQVKIQKGEEEKQKESKQRDRLKLEYAKKKASAQKTLAAREKAVADDLAQWKAQHSTVTNLNKGLKEGDKKAKAAAGEKLPVAIKMLASAKKSLTASQELVNDAKKDLKQLSSAEQKDLKAAKVPTKEECATICSALADAAKEKMKKADKAASQQMAAKQEKEDAAQSERGKAKKTAKQLRAMERRVAKEKRDIKKGMKKELDIAQALAEKTETIAKEKVAKV